MSNLSHLVFTSAQIRAIEKSHAKDHDGHCFDLMEEAGKKIGFEEVLANIDERDYIDTHRKTSPLTKAADAIELDNSDMTLEREMDWLRGILFSKFGICI